MKSISHSLIFMPIMLASISGCAIPNNYRTILASKTVIIELTLQMISFSVSRKSLDSTMEYTSKSQTCSKIDSNTLFRQPHTFLPSFSKNSCSKKILLTPRQSAIFIILVSLGRLLTYSNVWETRIDLKYLHVSDITMIWLKISYQPEALQYRFQKKRHKNHLSTIYSSIRKYSH